MQFLLSKFSLHVSRCLNGIVVKDYLLANDLHKILKFPTEEDLKGAAKAITRLQDTYDLDTEDMSRGILNGTRYR